MDCWINIERTGKMERGDEKERGGEECVERRKKRVDRRKKEEETKMGEREKKRKRWEEEKKILNGKIRDLELKEAMKEKEQRRKNIVIKGVIWKEEDLGHAVKKFIKEEIKVEVRVKRAKKIKLKGNEEIVVAELG